MSNTEFYYKAILATKKRITPEYGGNVMPAIEIFRGLTTPQQKRDYQSALELMLENNDQEVRRFAVTICLGFFVFKDVV